MQSCGALCVEYAYFGVQYGKEVRDAIMSNRA